MDKNVEDYLEYEYEDKNSKMTIKPVLSALVGKTKQAIKNRIEKEKIQQQLLNDTAERYGLGKDEIDDFLFKSYEDEDSCEYLVDGAILTCTNCTRENVYVKDEKASSDLVTVEKAYLAELDPSIDDSMFPDNDIKVYKRLKVTENLTANSNGLMHATIKDCIMENNIPSFGNCLSGPNCARENEIFQDEEATEKKGGTCQFLMRLESEWENYEIGQSFQSFDDDVEGEQIGITMTSTLFCKHGGFIYPVTSGQIIEITEIIEEDNYTETFWYTDKDGNIREVIWTISNEEFINYKALSLEEIEQICNKHNSELVTRGYAEGIYNFCISEGLNPKILLATLGQERGWCKKGGYEKAFGVGPGGSPKDFKDSNKGIAASGKAFLKLYNEGLMSNNLVLKGINCDPAPEYKETTAVYGEKTSEWIAQNPQYVQYMQNGLDIECANAAMYAKLRYTPWLDFPPSNSHPLEDWLSIYNKLEEDIKNEE